MSQRWVLQFCHSYYGPFLDVARQYAALFVGSEFKVLTVYLTGQPSDEVRAGSASDDVLFLDFDARQVRGLKLGAILAFRQIVKSRHFAFVIAHRFKPIFVACCASNLPVIGVHHGFGDYQRCMRQLFARLFQRRLSLLGVSNAVRDEIRTNLPDWPVAQIATLYNRLDVDAVRSEIVSRQDARTHLGLSQTGLVVGNVGRLHPDKDQTTLIAAFARALPELPPGSVLAIAGSGPLEADLRRQAEQLGVADSVRFLGQVSGVRRYFAAFDLFVLSSDHEPFGMVLLEAMAADVPVMATDCGGAPEVVADEKMLFALRDAEGLSKKMVSFFREPALISAQNVMRQRLVSVFSDAAARASFFSLPMVRALLDLNSAG